jgi:hypothetical protein
VGRDRRHSRHVPTVGWRASKWGCHVAASCNEMQQRLRTFQV